MCIYTYIYIYIYMYITWVPPRWPAWLADICEGPGVSLGRVRGETLSGLVCFVRFLL